jgi:hypothetical protein
MEKLVDQVLPARSPVTNTAIAEKSCGLRLALVLVAAIVVATVGSHSLASWLKIKRKAGQPISIGNPNGKPPAFLAGSSLASYGIAWDQISTQTVTEIKTWGVAGGSPYEWEQFQYQVPDARATYIVVSFYDLNEAMICDFRADLVPLSQTIRNLRAFHADWRYSKRALGQYPITWLRALFPTLGRSRGTMGKLREKVVNLIKPSTARSWSEAGPILDFGKATVVDDYKLQRISDWPKSKVMGKLVAMRVDSQDSQTFNGPKSLAFRRMLQYANQLGRTIVIVLPVSVSYSREFISPEMLRKFEASMDDAQRHSPRTEWLRLDKLAGLASDQNFCDLVHMNIFGQRIATESLQTWLQPTL